jgi:hypothetical protein
MSAERSARLDRSLILLLVITGICAVVKVWFAFSAMLVDDEAYYVMWSKHLALGYTEHPPLIAALIRASMSLFGPGEFGVRAWALIAWFALGIAAYYFGKRLHSVKTGLLLMAAVQVTPILAGVATIVTPDSAMLLLCFGAAFAYHEGFLRDPRWLALGGLLMGLALLAKISSGLLLLGIALYTFGTANGRRRLSSAYLWLGVAMCLALGGIYVFWNAQNAFIGFNWVMGGLLTKAGGLTKCIELWACQLALQTPLPLLLGLPVMLRALRGSWKQHAGETTGSTRLFFACLAVVPLVLVFIKSLNNKLEGNWPAIAFIGLTVLAVLEVAENWQNFRYRFWTTFNYAAMGMWFIVFAVQSVYSIIPIPLGIDMTKRFQANKVFAGDICEFVAAEENKNARYFGVNYQVPSMLNYYARPPFEATCLRFGGYHPTAYDLWGLEPRAGDDRYLLTADDVSQEVEAHFDKVTLVKMFPGMVRGQVATRYRLYRCEGFRPDPNRVP